MCIENHDGSGSSSGAGGGNRGQGIVLKHFCRENYRQAGRGVASAIARPAFLTTWRGEVRERAVRTRREPGVLANRLLHPSRQETRPFRFTGRQTFLLARTRPPLMVFTNHETRNTNHGLLSRASTVGW